MEPAQRSAELGFPDVLLDVRPAAKPGLDGLQVAGGVVGGRLVTMN